MHIPKQRWISIVNTGSQSWDIISAGAAKLEASWKRSIKIIDKLPWPDHRRLMAPVYEKTHMKILLMTRMTSFVKNLKKSKKLVLRQLIRLTMTKTQSIK